MAPSEVICTSYSNREASVLSSGCDTEGWNETSGAGKVLLLCGRMCSAEKQPTSLRECLPGSWTSVTEDSTEALQWPACHKMARQPDNCCKDSKVAKKEVRANTGNGPIPVGRHESKAEAARSWSRGCEQAVSAFGAQTPCCSGGDAHGATGDPTFAAGTEERAVCQMEENREWKIVTQKF